MRISHGIFGQMSRWRTTGEGWALDPMFHDRRDAGRRLGQALQGYADADPVILALPRGGVPVADEVAKALRAPLDVVVVCKLSSPSNPEYGFGAIGEGGALVIDDTARHWIGVDDVALRMIVQHARSALERRIARYRVNRPMPAIDGRTVIVVDDGLATGSTSRAAVSVLRHLGAARIIVAVPTGSAEAVERLRADADAVVCLEVPAPFGAVGAHYVDFAQTTDDEVLAILGDRHRSASVARHGDGSDAATQRTIHHQSGMDEPIVITISPDVALPGHLTVPAHAIGIVVFAHGSGSSRHSPRNTAVARTLQEAGLGTLLFDLLTPQEGMDRTNAFDLTLLADRLARATDWLRVYPAIVDLPIGYFGASTGAAAALLASAGDGRIAAVVSRGGRPDLAGSALARVAAPTLLIVGSLDDEVMALNRAAQRHMTCRTQLAVVSGATHLFEEVGTLARVAHLARDWFTAEFSRARSASMSGGPRGS